MGERCPYPEFYEKIGSAALIAHEVEPTPMLPMDDRGTCIFHSQDVAWKRENDFKGKFLELVRLLNADVNAKYFDFAEFVFVGNETRAKGGSEEHVLRISDTTFRRQTYFMAASFLDSLELDGVDFQNGAMFSGATFARNLSTENSRFCGLDFVKAKVAQIAFFGKVEFLSFSLFQNAQFAGVTDGYAVRFEDARFQGITDFSGAVFDVKSSVGFLKVRFEDFTDFRGTQFNCHVVFDDVLFASVAEFIDTLFDTVGSAARYRGSAVEFNGIEVPIGAVLTFMSTDLESKMFNHDVQMSFKEEPAGTIRLENVNFSRFTPASKGRLTQLAKAGRVEIGSGCIKYRFQTDVRTISISQGNAPLVLELCQTFANYFTVSNGINLGLEIVERDEAKVRFFYYTDENISQVEFLGRLAHTEQRLWNLLSIRSDEQVLALEGPTAKALSTSKESAVINAVDGVSALLGTFFRVGVRIALGTWKEADTKALLGAIRFNDEGAESRALSLHRVIIDKYTGRALFG
ncbi:MAG: pentapeptide repeat-containing protein, partial [Nitrospira sp.]